VYGLKHQKEKRSMDHFAGLDVSRQIALAEKFPCLAFSFEPFDPTVLVHHPSAPECEKSAVG
jgi:hypothetical protein